MKATKTVFLILLMASLNACNTGSSDQADTDNSEGAIETPDDDLNDDNQNENTASAQLTGASNSSVTGTAMFTQDGDETVRLEIQVNGLTPGQHALHLHENGDCSAPDASSAGSHWNPTNQPHGERGKDQFHKGDIANLEVGDDGTVSWSEDIEGWTIGGPDSTNILNKAVIIHSGADNFTTQPSGDAGDRVACGVIQQTSM